MHRNLWPINNPKEYDINTEQQGFNAREANKEIDSTPMPTKWPKMSKMLGKLSSDHHHFKKGVHFIYHLF